MARRTTLGGLLLLSVCSRQRPFEIELAEGSNPKILPTGPWRFCLRGRRPFTAWECLRAGRCVWSNARGIGDRHGPPITDAQGTFGARASVVFEYRVID
jgi:hypothetical protein